MSIPLLQNLKKMLLKADVIIYTMWRLRCPMSNHLVMVLNVDAVHIDSSQDVLDITQDASSNTTPTESSAYYIDFSSDTSKLKAYRKPHKF